MARVKVYKYRYGRQPIADVYINNKNFGDLVSLSEQKSVGISNRSTFYIANKYGEGPKLEMNLENDKFYIIKPKFPSYMKNGNSKSKVANSLLIIFVLICIMKITNIITLPNYSLVLAMIALLSGAIMHFKHLKLIQKNAISSARFKVVEGRGYSIEEDDSYKYKRRPVNTTGIISTLILMVAIVLVYVKMMNII